MLIAQKFDDYVTTVAHGGFRDDLSEEALKAYAKRLDPDSMVRFQPSVLVDDKGEYLIEFSDGSVSQFDQCD